MKACERVLASALANVVDDCEMVFLQVFKAVDRVSGQEVALKRIFLRQPELGIPSNVLREYRALQLLHDDRLVKLLDVFPMVCFLNCVACKTIPLFRIGDQNLARHAGIQHCHCHGALLHQFAHHFGAARLSSPPVCCEAADGRRAQGSPSHAFSWCESSVP